MTRATLRFAVILALAGFGLPIQTEAQKIPLGLEFRANTFTTNNQGLPAVAADADGDFVVVWDSLNQDGYSYGIFGQRYSSAGAPVGVEFQANAFTNSGQRVAGVAMEPDGDFVVVWRSGAQSEYEIVGRRFTSAGAPLTGDFQVNTYSPGQQLNPVVAMNTAGDFVVAWFSVGQDGSLGGIFAQRFSSSGAAVGGELQVNTYTADYQRNPTVALRAGGDFVVAWQSNLQDGSSWGVFARRFSTSGTLLASEFQVTTYTSDYQGNPSIVARPDGGFAVVWESKGQDGAGYGIFARRFSSDGAAIASEFQINQITANGERLPFAAAGANGDFVVAWQDYGGTSTHEVFARRFSSAGAPRTSAFQVNTYTPGPQQRAAVAAAADGDFVVVWESPVQDGSGYGVFGQRFAAIVGLDVDGNGGVTPLTDGLLVLRYFFGFTDDTLISGAVGAGCTRCDAAAIEAYLAELGLALDIDGNGALGALTDGLLALRYLFGFTGTVLTNGAIGGGCSRCDASSIEADLRGLTM